MRKILIFAFIFWGISCFLLGFLVDADETSINRFDINFSYKWFGFEVTGKEIAYINEDCKIITKYPLSKYKYITAELEKYSGFCKESKEIGKEIKGE